MKKVLTRFLVLFLLFSAHLSALPNEGAAESPRASLKSQPIKDEAYDATLKDIQTTLGLVPSFFKVFPQKSLPGAWLAFKNVQLSPNTTIPPKYKELLGLAVASQMPCAYCTFFHTEASKLSGGTEGEIQEAIALAASARQWSTILNGTQTDLPTFRSEVDRVMTRLREAASKGTTTSPTVTQFATADDALRDIEQTFGEVPTFIRSVPREGLPGLWSELKTLEIAPDTAIPPKYKSLIGLGVSSQIPCPYCVYFDTESAKLDGATEQEIQEAVTVASLSRHWSTVINGAQTDPTTFRKEMTQAFAHLKKGAEKTKN